MELRKQFAGWLSLSPCCFDALHHKIEPKKVFFRRLCFVACKAVFQMIAVHAQSKVRGLFSAQKGGQLWERYQEKHIPKNSWITGQICIIPITRHIELTPTIVPIRWIQTTDRTGEFTMRTAETKHIGCPCGRLTIRNTMIKNWRHTVCQSTFSTTMTATSPWAFRTTWQWIWTPAIFTWSRRGPMMTNKS